MSHIMMRQQPLADNAIADRDVEIGMLMSMGFSVEQAVQALDDTNGNVDDAIDYLVFGGNGTSSDTFCDSQECNTKDKNSCKEMGNYYDVEKQLNTAGAIQLGAGDDIYKEKVECRNVTRVANPSLLDPRAFTRDNRMPPETVCPGAVPMAGPKTARPGAVAVAGSSRNEDHEIYVGRREEHHTCNSLLPIAATVVSNHEENYTELQERLRILEERARGLPSSEEEPGGSPHEPVHESYYSRVRRTRNIWIGLVGVALLLAAVGLVLGFTLPRVLSPDTTPDPLLEGTTLESLTDMLSSVSPDGGAALGIKGTPQNKALKWLAGNAKLDSYSYERKIQRYVLATFYYSTNGHAWTDNTGWLIDSDECGWYNDASFCFNDAVVSLDFYVGSTGNNLVGTIPNELALLSDSIGKYSC